MPGATPRHQDRRTREVGLAQPEALWQKAGSAKPPLVAGREVERERESESILKRVNLRPCRVSSRPKDSRGAGTPLRPELPCYDPYSPLRPETTNASSGRSLAQQVFDVFLPSRRSGEVRCAPDPASLEQTCSASFLQRN